MTEEAEQIHKRAEFVMKKGRWADAIKILKSDPVPLRANWKFNWEIGWCYFKLSKFDIARKYMIRATRLAPENHVCKWGLGSVYLKKRNFGKAEIVLTEALKAKESTTYRMSLALALLSQGKVEEAERVHLDGIGLEPGNSDRLGSYAAFLSDVGRESEAKAMERKVKRLRKPH